MEIPMTPANKENIKEQYNQGNPVPQQQGMSDEELAKKKKEREEYLDSVLPFMRKEEEYSRLQIALTEADVLMGRVAPNQVPGLLGVELLVRYTQAEGYMAQWAAGQKDAANQAQTAKTIEQQEVVNGEKWATLTEEEQTRIRTAVEAHIKESGMGDAYEALKEVQRINVIMMTAEQQGLLSSKTATTETETK